MSGNGTEYEEVTMFKKLICVLSIVIAAVSAGLAQEGFKPRDADEAEGWQIYNQYKASRAAEAMATRQIKQAIGDVGTTSLSSIGLLGSDPSDRERLNELRQKVDAERQKQAQLLAKWGDKFYWRYGDLAWAEDKIKDPGTKREMDRIEFALTYFPFNPKKNNPSPAPEAGSTSLTLQSPGYWGVLSYTISGAKLEPPSGGDSGKVAGRQYKGLLSGTILTVSGTATSSNPSSGPGSLDYYELRVSVAAGKEHKEYNYIAPNGERLSKSFSLSVPVAPGSSGSFAISLLEQNANYGPHGWVVGGSLAGSPTLIPVTAPAGGRAATANNLSVEYDTDRPGGDYRNFDLPEANFELCRNACAADPNCKAYTYVKPGVQGIRSRCWLKSSVSGSGKSTSCISGIKP